MGGESFLNRIAQPLDEPSGTSASRAARDISEATLSTLRAGAQACW